MSTSANKGKIVIIGAGNVGSTIAYTVMMSQMASEIVLIDVNKEKARVEALDMNHGIAFFKQLTIRDGDYEDCGDADMIIVTAGTGRKPGQTRIDLAKVNVSIARDIARSIMKYAVNPIILVVSNPVDILTYMIQKETGLPANRVFGSGTTLDTARFRYLLSQQCGVDVRNVHANIIGEHGDSELPVWSRANIAGNPFSEFEKEHPELDRSEIFNSARSAAVEIIKAKGATFYGIALSVSRIVTAVMMDEHSVLTVSSSLSGQYGLSDVSLSLPCVVGTNGIERVMDVEMSPEETAALQESAQKLQEVIREVL